MAKTDATLELCYFCGKKIENGEERDLHHPNKKDCPDWVVPAHKGCHHRYHKDAGHFAEWGSWSPYAGKEGYIRVIRKWPGFHRMGGIVRAHTAKRDTHGRFI